METEGYIYFAYIGIYEGLTMQKAFIKKMQVDGRRIGEAVRKYNEAGKRRILSCNRCGYLWATGKKKDPKNCANPKCNSPYWNKARVV